MPSFTVHHKTTRIGTWPFPRMTTGIVGQPGGDVGESVARFDVVELGVFDQGENRGGALAAIVRTMFVIWAFLAGLMQI